MKIGALETADLLKNFKVEDKGQKGRASHVEIGHNARLLVTSWLMFIDGNEESTQDVTVVN